MNAPAELIIGFTCALTFGAIIIASVTLAGLVCDVLWDRYRARQRQMMRDVERWMSDATEGIRDATN